MNPLETAETNEDIAPVIVETILEASEDTLDTTLPAISDTEPTTLLTADDTAEDTELHAFEVAEETVSHALVTADETLSNALEAVFWMPVQIPDKVVKIPSQTAVHTAAIESHTVLIRVETPVHATTA